MLIMYFPVSVAGYMVFGKDTPNNIIAKLNDNWLKITATILITGHLLTAFNIILNPLFQGLEETFKAPKSKFKNNLQFLGKFKLIFGLLKSLA